MANQIPRIGSWSIPAQTQALGTAIVQGIPPWPGRRNSRPLYDRSTKNWLQMSAFTHVTKYTINAGSTAHAGTFMRPLNWTWTTVAAAAGATTLTLFDDPGIYSTNYRYPLPGGATYPASAADNGVATNDFIAVQLIDGSWVFRSVTVAGLVMTIAALPSPTSGGAVAAGAVVFWFGVSTDTDPATGYAHPTIQPVVSVQSDLGEISTGLVAALHSGDPMLLYNGNATAADTVAACSGYYGKY